MAKSKARHDPIAMTEEFSAATAYLIQTWANCETWFMRVLAILLRIDVTRCDLVFSSFTSTRARVGLVRRAAIMCLPHVRQIRHLNKLCNQFNSITTTRNKVCHAEYLIGPHGNSVVGLLSTNFTRGDFDGTNHHEKRNIDQGFINEIHFAGTVAVKLANSLERFMKIHAASVLELPRLQPAPLAQIQKSKRRRRGHQNRRATKPPRRAP